MSALEHNLVLVAQWGTIVTGLLFVATLIGIWRLGRGRRLLVPATWGRRGASAGLLVLALVFGFALFLLNGPMRPMLAEVRRLQTLIGQPAGDIAFRQVADGSPRRLHDFRGQVVVVNLWATWCPPCRAEMPDLNRLQREYRRRGLAVVTVSDEPRETIQGFAAKQPFTTTNVFAESLGWLDVPGRPLSIVIDRDGTVRRMFIGSRDYETFEAAVQPYLG
ncbi:MAG TPA: TlpA disulfide reductase family protein [Thermoanaerobaculia bacterium]|jgi:thiol-disulfide isomerase/thioredoxin|nr:TlpA disulfide reductase family protein [Thermoanaerobaculia bacterium]